jgi:signal transduction histidine kinase/CheY-like chemotaxis protein
MKNNPQNLMSMLKYPLYEFITTVPSCLETSTVKIVLEIFEQEQCDRLVVLNEQQSPVGVLYSARLLPQVLAANQAGNAKARALNLQSLVEPIQTVPAAWGVEEFGWFLRSQKNQNNNNRDWALIDSDGKFFGLVDSSRLLQFWANQRGEIQTDESKHSPILREVDDASKPAAWVASPKVKSRRRKVPMAPKSTKEGIAENPSLLRHQPLIQLLERLPWPLMLQTGTGEIVTQNPAWWQQLGILKDPEGIRQQVEAILTPAIVTNPAYATTKAVGNPTKNDYHYQAQSTSIKLLADVNNLPESPQLSSGKNRCFLDSQQGTCTCVVEVQNGQERVWQFAKIPLDSPDLQIESPQPDTAIHPDLWLMLATDVTEQQQLCKELAAKNADLIQLNRLKDEFLACISHELKTPLTAVLGLSRLLVDKQLGELNERQARYAGLIHQSGRHLMSVVNDILDLTRMETGQMELMPASVKIRAVCDRAVGEAKAIHAQNRRTTISHQPHATSDEHQFSLTIEPGLEEIVADEFRLRQMLVHLLSNAFKFTETGGEIGLRVNRWEGWIAFTVWDTGIGIPEHQQHLIFQKFQQLENPLTRQFEGTGLGLVLTRALARLHGGDVTFLSREGKGSQFTLLLPPSPPQKIGEGEGGKARGRENSQSSLTSPPRIKTPGYLPHSDAPWRVSTSSPTPSIPPPQNHLNSLVLVVEGVARYIEDLTEQLTGLGYRVVIARSGCEAVEKARRLQPQAIFLNPLLPLLSGWDVLTLLKSDATTRQIPVIVTATGAEKEQAFANRADGFLSLPVEHQFLAPLLESLCTIPQGKQQEAEREASPIHTPLRILRLVNPEGDCLVDFHPLLQQHRVIEVDDIEQAELLARVWQFDVVLLDAEMPASGTYLQKLSKHPRLATLPLVTCDVATTQTASQIAGLSVFPCLMNSHADNSNDKKIEALLSVLQIAAGICCPPSILVVDLAILPDLPEAKRQHMQGDRSQENFALANLSLKENASFSTQDLKPLTISRGSEWFQALIQYLQTAGLKATMGRSWAEMLQQLRHESVDLLLICLGESNITKEVYSALQTIGQLPVKLPPVLILDQRLNPHISEENLLENAAGAITSEILPRSISMEDLLIHINQALAANT